MTIDRSWIERGECTTNPNLQPADFYLEGRFVKNSTAYRQAVGKAKGACGRCPVRAECLEYSFEAGEEEGIWGGLTQWERKAIRSQRFRAAQAARAAGG